MRFCWDGGKNCCCCEFMISSPMPSNHAHLSSYMNSTATIIAPAPQSAQPAAVTTPTTPTANSNSSTPNASRLQQKNPKLYKTELCRSWMETGRCNYGDRCQYAHGEKEKRHVPRHPKYKTEPCQSYHKTGYCPYGPRCHFIHNESPAQLKALIMANEQALHMVQDLAALGIDNSKKTAPTMLTSSSSAASLGAYRNNPSPYTSGGIFGNQKGNNATMPLMNGQNQFLAKAQSFANCQGNFPFQCSNAPTRPPPKIPLQQQMGMDHFGGNSGNALGTSYPGTNTNFAKNFWSNELAHQFEHPNEKAFGHDRPNNLGLHARSGFHSEQISPSYFTPLDELIKQQSKSPNFTLPFANDPMKRHGVSAKGKAGEIIGDELDPQQLLGNFCSSDDEYSRSSIISSNIDSGNESPLATFDEEARMRQMEQFKKSQTPLPMVADETQPRRSSDGDTTSNDADAANMAVSNSTASSSMASLLSSSSSNSTAHHMHKFMIGPPSSVLQPSSTIPPTHANSQKIRLPVFERLSLNQ